MFLFKGNRNYLHSTDIYSYLEDNFSFDRIDIKFYKFLKSQPSLKIYQQSKIKRKVPHSISANVFQKNKSSIINFYPTKKKITSSYSYDESLLNKYFKINKNLISCNFTTDIKYIDLIVSMSKLWHQKKINKKRKWIVIRLVIEKKFNSNNRKKIRIISERVIDNKFTTSKIFINNILIGKIYYSYV